MHKYKNIIFLIIFILLAVFILIINIIVDPFQIKNNIGQNRILKIIDERDYVYTCLNLTRNNKYDYLFLTGSSGEFCINTNYFKKHYGNIAIIDILGGSPLEQFNLLKYYLKLHPETKNIIISLEFNTYLSCFKEYTIPRFPNNQLVDFIKLYFSADVTKKSIRQIITNFNTKNKRNEISPSSQTIKNFHPNPLVYTAYKKRRYSYSQTCEYDNIEALKKIYNLIQEKNLNAVYFIPPVNVLYLADIKKQGYYANMETLKKMYAQIVPFYYDMAYVNSNTIKPIGAYFVDVMHSNSIAFNKKILNTLFKKEVDEDFAVYITKENVDKVITKQKNDLFKYIENNKNYVNEYVNFEYDSKLEDKYAEKVFYNDTTSEQKAVLREFSDF